MPIYSYKALSNTGALLRGEQVAESQAALAQDLQRKGFLVQGIRKKRPFALPILQRRRIKTDAFLMFCQELTALLKAGLTLTDALDLSAQRTSPDGMDQIIKKIAQEIRAGSALSAACAAYPEVFDGLFISSLQTGEKTGDMVPMLRRYQVYLKRKIALRRKVTQALAYPAFLLLTLLLVLLILFVVVMPRFVKMYTDLDAPLPLPTQLLMSVLEYLPFIGTGVLLMSVLAWLGFRFWVSSDSGRLQADALKLRLPFSGAIRRSVLVAQTARTLATLLGGGMNVVDALRATAEGTPNRAYAQGLRQTLKTVVEGGGVASAILNAQVLPLSAAKMLEAGEAAGDLAGPLSDVADYYEEQLESQLTRLTLLIEPVLMLIMGVFVGGVIVVMYLPIFSVASVIQ